MYAGLCGTSVSSDLRALSDTDKEKQEEDDDDKKQHQKKENR